MYSERIDLYKSIENVFDTKLLVYVTSDRQGMCAQIAQDAIDYFIGHLDKIGVCKRISLYLYTRGGDTAAAWNIINLLRMYCDELQVIVPHKAHSAGTIISLGANEIIMTKQATLGPIDPSVNTSLNPLIPNSAGQTYPVSVEAIKGYLEFAKNELSIRDDSALSNIYIKLTDKVHPIVLGQVYRSKAQIQMLAQKLLKTQVQDQDKVKRIIDFLCSDSGSHDYTVNRREAELDLGLKVKKPTEEQYKLIKSIYDDISDELLFTQPFNTDNINGKYICRRCLLESVVGGSDYYVTEGQVLHGQNEAGQNIMQHNVLFEGWKHESIASAEEGDNSSREIDQEIEYERSNEFQM